MEKEAAKRPLPPAAHPPRSMAFKIFNDSILICRHQSATAPWDSAMDRGNLTDLTAFVLADRASFLCEGKSAQWVNRVFRPWFGHFRSAPYERT
jgi:hypothetical protein